MAANEKQVGGTHYHSPTGYQHWDMVVDHQLNYFEGQITKYVMRARRKNGVQDLQKAMHFLEKYIEVYDRIQASVAAVEASTPGPVTTKQAATLQAEAALNSFTLEGYYGDNTQHYKCVFCKEDVRAHSAEEAYRQHSACALAHSQFQHP